MFKYFTNFVAACWSFRANLKSYRRGVVVVERKSLCLNSLFIRAFFCCLKSHNSLFFSPQHNGFPTQPCHRLLTFLTELAFRDKTPLNPPSRVISPSINLPVGTGCGKCFCDQRSGGGGPQESEQESDQPSHNSNFWSLLP